MSNTVQIKCNLGHWHDIDQPDDLISITEAAKIAKKSMNTLMTRIDKGDLVGYPGQRQKRYKGQEQNLISYNKMISRSQLLELYPNATA
jgi:hypothetical protein